MLISGTKVVGLRKRKSDERKKKKKLPSCLDGVSVSVSTRPAGVHCLLAHRNASELLLSCRAVSGRRA